LKPIQIQEKAEIKIKAEIKTKIKAGVVMLGWLSKYYSSL